jgi:membrane protein DedA with SNARE-associated domain
VPLGSITDRVTEAIGDAGVYAVFGLMAFDAVFPAASELVMVYAGAVAAGAFSGAGVTLFGADVESTGWGFVVMALAGTIGYWLGSLLGWAIGAYGGRPLLERHGRWLHLGPERLERAEDWFERKGDAAVFVGRMLPVVRSFVSVPAGVLEFPFGRYTVLTLLGTVPWCFGLAGIGVGLGESWERFHEAFRYADIAIVVAIALGAAYLVYRVWRRRASGGRAPARAVPPDRPPSVDG